MKLSHLLSVLVVLLIASASASDNKIIDNKISPCMNIKYSPEVIDCMMQIAKRTKKEYSMAFKDYLTSSLNKDEISRDKESFITIAKKAKEGWDLYTENECLAQAAVYEKGKDGYNSEYNICLIEKYSQRIEYYKENK